ncbi:tetratricopeptide repeat protein [Streptomyces pacificus]|uniref:Tetratricopeptide repeat protein n=1 Tax=Streptomyces pacificus TaxID=2705029 RepID=A0A6A0AXQ4_9ACTN|nr:tetratricopeptide repeat protein [Streptomyces pacificus]GFH37101.1 tetratricopeptide repeat protein [Streptomyces pacificus]
MTRTTRSRWRLGAAVVGLAFAFTAAGAVLGGAEQMPATPAAAGAVVLGADPGQGVRALQTRLKARPGDAGAWAALGAAYVEEARAGGDPSRYPQAAEAFARSLRLRPDGNADALAGRAALAAARHDFPAALRDAERALAVNPYSEHGLAVRIDALVELGRYPAALDAALRADARRPGIPVFTRLAYVRELLGETEEARRVLELARNSASTRADVAYTATALGRLAWSQGDYDEALRQCGQALKAEPDQLEARECRARALTGKGQLAAAVAEFEEIVGRSPLPGRLVALGELYEASGSPGPARRQYEVLDTWAGLARAGGVNPDLDTALAAADHGDRAEALRAARAEWQRRRTVHTEDALAWALHRAGRSAEALPHARAATATGYPDASFLYHRGMIERAAGERAAARTSLSRALALNPAFSPLGAREARRALDGLEAT